MSETGGDRSLILERFFPDASLEQIRDLGLRAHELQKNDILSAVFGATQVVFVERFIEQEEHDPVVSAQCHAAIRALGEVRRQFRTLENEGAVAEHAMNPEE